MESDEQPDPLRRRLQPRAVGPRGVGRGLRRVRPRRDHHGDARGVRVGAPAARRGPVRLLAARRDRRRGPPPRAARSCWRRRAARCRRGSRSAHPDACRVDFEGRRHVYGQRHNHCPSLDRRSRGCPWRSPAGSPSGTATTRRSSRGTSATSTAAPATASCAGRRSASGSASGTPRWTGSTTRGTPRSGRTRSPTGTRSSRRRPCPSTGADRTTPRSRASPSTTAASCPTRCSAGFLAEKAAIRAHVPHTPVTTNLMGLYQPIDYHRWAEHLDLATWDNYPPEDPSPIRTAARMALAHEAMRGLRGRRAVLGDGADPVDHRQPRRQRREAPGRARAVDVAVGGARRRRDAVLPAAAVARRVREVPRRRPRPRGPDGHPGVPRGRRAGCAAGEPGGRHARRPDARPRRAAARLGLLVGGRDVRRAQPERPLPRRAHQLPPRAVEPERRSSTSSR